MKQYFWLEIKQITGVICSSSPLKKFWKDFVPSVFKRINILSLSSCGEYQKIKLLSPEIWKFHEENLWESNFDE